MNPLTRILDSLASLAHPNPERDWLLTLGIILVPFLCLMLYAAYTFFGLQSGFIIRSNPAPFPSQTITEEEIESVLDIYRARKAKYEAGTPALTPALPPPTPGAGQ